MQSGQSPIVSTAVTTHLADQVFTTDNNIEFAGITSFYGGDLIKIGNEFQSPLRWRYSVVKGVDHDTKKIFDSIFPYHFTIWPLDRC